MIPYTSCMCFNADGVRGRPWRIVSAQKGTSLVVTKDEDHSFCIQIGEVSTAKDPAEIRSALTTSEECILKAVLLQQKSGAMSSGEEEVRVVSNRMSRQPVITKVFHLHLLDGTYSGVTNVLLSKCGSWSFNTFNLDISTGGRSLSYLLVHLFHEYEFVKHFKLDVVKVWHCFSLMEAAYHRHNPYHNSVHAADVTQAMHCFLQENKFASHLTPLEAMSSVIAAVAHDLDHPGVTQAFLVATSNHLVNLYHNSSVLENHHWRTAISCLSESGIFDHLDRDMWVSIQKHIKSLILATDITRQKEFLTKFKNYLHTESLDMEDSQYRLFALQIALKCADLCNPCRPWPISQRWSYQVCQEFYRQGAYERELRLPLTPTFDCSRTKVAKIQADFFQFVVSPLFETWDHFLQTPLSARLLRNLRHNYYQWQLRMEAIQRATEAEFLLAREEIAPEIVVDDSSVSVEDIQSSQVQNEPELLTIDTSDIVLKQHRSRSDSGLSPRLLSPKIHMETYSTEELHPSTTLLSLSSITNTVQLRQVYATTKVESHLICPTVFQPTLSASGSVKRPTSLTTEAGSDDPSENKDSELVVTAQSPALSSCPDGCCTPCTVPDKPTLGSPQSLVDGSDSSKPHCQLSWNRRASDFCSRTIDNKPLVTRCKSQALISTSSQQPSNTCTPSETNEDCVILGDDIKDDDTIRVSNRENSFNDASGPSGRTVSSVGNPTISLDGDNSSHSPQSWCWHISRSFSAERPQRPSQDFDSLVPSMSSNTHVGSVCPGYGGRRASAPMAVTFNPDLCGSHSSGLGDIDSKGGLRGGSEDDCNFGRRWSIPMETLTGTQIAKTTSSTDIPESHSITDVNIRRHSFGPFDPLFAMSALEYESRELGSTVQPNQTGCNIFESLEMLEPELNEQLDTETVSSCDTPLPCFSSSRSASVPRRGSLPAEVPIALMCHVASPSRHLPKPICSEQFSSTKEPNRSQCIHSNRSSHLWEHNKRHGSPTDLLSVLIGPTGLLNTMHDIASSRSPRKFPCAVAMDSSRRRSGGLEMLSGLWRSRTSETPISIGMAAKIKLQRQLLEDWASWRGGEDSHVSTGASISALSQQLAYQQRRGSVPLNASLLSLSSGNTCSGEHVD